MSSVLISGGLVVDGTGREAFPADVLVEGDRIADVVERSGRAALPRGLASTEIDATGCLVTPGFIENHCHLMMYGQSLLELPIRDRSKEEILSMAAEAAKSLAPGEWLVGGMGWNNEVWEDPSYPTKEELDQVCADNPVMMPRMDGHMIWVNSKALEVCGVTADTPDPEGGEFFRNEDGALQGCCANAASQLIKSFIPKPDEEARRKAYLAAQDAMLSFGITTVTDMSTSLEMVREPTGSPVSR